MSNQPTDTQPAALYRLTPGHVEMILAMAKTMPFTGTVDQLPSIVTAVQGLREALARPLSADEVRAAVKPPAKGWVEE